MFYNNLIDLGHVPSVLVSAKANKRFLFDSEFVPTTDDPSITSTPATSVKTDVFPDGINNAVALTIRNATLLQVSNSYYCYVKYPTTLKVRDLMFDVPKRPNTLIYC